MRQVKTHSALHQILTGTRLVFYGLGYRAAMLFFVQVFLARMLGPDSYGFLTWSLTIVNLTVLLSGLGLGTACQRFVPIFLDRSEPAKALGIIVFSAKATIVAAVVLSIVLASLELSYNLVSSDAESGQGVFLILSLIIPFWVAQRLLLSVAAARKRVVLKVLAEDFLVPTMFMVTVVIVAIADLSLQAIAAGYLFVYVLSVIFLAIAVKRDEVMAVRPVSINGSDRREILHFSGPLILSDLLGKTTGILEFLVIGIVATATQVGLFRSISDLAAMMLLIPMGFSFLYIPIASEYHGREILKEWHSLNARLSRLMMLLSFPIFSWLFFHAEIILTLIYGEVYSVSANALKILAVAYFINVAVGFTGLNLVAAGETRLQLAAKLASILVLVALIVVLVPRFGVVGAAFATLGSVICSNTVNMIAVVRLLGIHPFSDRYFVYLATLIGSSLFVELALGNVVADRSAAVLFMPVLISVFLILFWCDLILDTEDRRSLRLLIRGR